MSLQSATNRRINARKALGEQGVTPPGVDRPELYRVRSASVVLPKDVSWVEATEETLNAVTDLPVASVERTSLNQAD